MTLKEAMKKAKEIGKPQTVTKVPKYTSTVINYGKWKILRSRTIVAWRKYD